MAVTVVLGVAWALLMQGGQAPDEPSHTAYVQILAEKLRGPKPDDPANRESGYSTEQKLARDLSHQQWQYAQPKVKSVWDPAVERRWEAESAKLGRDDRTDGGGPNSAYGNPVLYYAYEALAYRAVGGSFFDRLFAMRIWSALLLAVGVVGTWLLVGELTARDRLSQLVAAGCVGLQPMATFVSASINPDAGLLPLWALAFWLGVRILRGPVRAADVAGVVVVTAAALLTKATSYALVPALAFLAAVVARRELRRREVSLRRVVPFAVVGIVVLGLAAVLAGGRLGNAASFRLADLSGFASYVWQAYAPNLPFQTPVPHLAAFEGYDIWIRTGWAAFGWLEIQFPAPVYVVLAAISALVVVSGLVAVGRRRFPLEPGVLAFFAIAAVVMVLGLHWAEYRQFVTQQQSFIQGRYLLPLLPLGGVIAAAALTNLRPGRRSAGAGALLGGLLVLQLFSLGLVAVRFYV